MQFLKELGLEGELLGCYTGSEWIGHGSSLTSLSPASGEVIGVVRQATEEDYEACLANMEKAKAAWAEVGAY